MLIVSTDATDDAKSESWSKSVAALLRLGALNVHHTFHSTARATELKSKPLSPWNEQQQELTSSLNPNQRTTTCKEDPNDAE